MSTRDKCAYGLPVLGLLLLVAGLATASNLLLMAGLFVIATAVRYRRKRPPLWAYLALLVFAVSIVALIPTSPPWVAGIPLMLSYVLDYLDERRWTRASASQSTVGNEGRPAAGADAPQDGPATKGGTVC